MTTTLGKTKKRKLMEERLWMKKKNDGFKYIRQNNILLRGPLSLNNQ